MTEDGHNYTFGSPSCGWPTFGPDGRIKRAAQPERSTDDAAEASGSPVKPSEVVPSSSGVGRPHRKREGRG